MLKNIQKQLKELLLPYKGAHHYVSRERCTDEDLHKLELEIVKILTQAFSDTPNPSSLFKQWASCCHPDLEIKKFKLNNQMIGAELMREIDQLFQGTCQQSSNNGYFFQLLTKAFKTIALQKFSSRPCLEKIETMVLLMGAQGYTFNEDTLQLNDWNKDCYLSIYPAAYCTTIETWLNFKVHHFMSEYFGETPSSRKYEHLKQALQTSHLHQWLLPTEGSFAQWLQIKADDIFHNPDTSRHLPVPLSHYTAIIKYHLQHAQQLITEDALTPKDYAYEMYQILRACLFDNPRLFMRPSNTIPPINKKYSEMQYNLLQTIFKEGSDPAFLMQFGLTKEILDKMNQKLCVSTPWNWLKETTNWIYAHGEDAAFSYPRAYVNARTGQTYPQEYDEAYSKKQFDKFVHSIKRHRFTIGLNRFPEPIKYAFLALPFVISAMPLFFSLTGLAWIMTSLIMITTLSCVMVSLTGHYLSRLHGFLESFLDNIARLNTPEMISHPNPRFSDELNQYHAQIFTPLKRLLFNPLDRFYQGSTRIILQLLYPARAILGVGLALASTITFSTQTLLHRIVAPFIINYFGLANLYFDYPVYLSKFKQFAQQAYQTMLSFKKKAPLEQSPTSPAPKLETPVVVSPTPPPSIPSLPHTKEEELKEKPRPTP